GVGRTVKDIGDDLALSAAAASAIATGDPRILKRATLLEEIEEIESFQRSYKKERSTLDIEIRAINLTIKELNAASSYATEHASSAHKAFTLTMHATGATHTEETVGEALYKTLAKLPHDIEETPIATLNNHFTLTAATPRN